MNFILEQEVLLYTIYRHTPETCSARHIVLNTGMYNKGWLKVIY